jgi:hypothetical protein
MSERFAIQQHEDGQIYVTENGVQMLHAEISGEHEAEIQIPSTGKITIDKLYGPTIFWDIRISCDINTVEWVIERSMGPRGTWKEWCRIPGQLDEDFSDGS